ncbi:MAG: hypothetical protein U9Q34_04980, partial [Elusimicrobiota bacterium]|nr:hypothetical protein [Elusimicrobiota bacterium]
WPSPLNVDNYAWGFGYDTKANIFNMGIGDAYVEQGTPEELYEDLGISADKIAKRIQDWLK